MQKITVLWIFLILVSYFCYAKEFVAESFSHLSEDFSAKLKPTTDLNEEVCALLKVECPIPNCQFSEAVGDIINEDNVYYVYLSPGTRRLSIRCHDYDNLIVDFKSISDILGVKSGETYVMTLSSNDNAKTADIFLFDAIRRGIEADSLILLPVDISARTKERLDATGKKCALIKVSLPIPGCSFSGIVGSPEFNVNEYYIHVSPDTDEIFLQCPGFIEIPIILAEKLNGEKLQSSSTYRLHVSGYNTSFVEFTPQFRSMIDQYEEVNEFKEGIAKVRKDGYNGIITTAGYEVVPCIYEEISDFEDGVAKVKKDGYYGIVTTVGYEVVPCIYEEIDNFNEGFAKVKKGDKYGYISSSGKEIVDCKYDESFYFMDGRAVVKRNGKYGFINSYGDEIIPCIYDKFEHFNSAMFHAETDKLKLDRTLMGTTLALMFDSNGLIGFLRDGKWGLLNLMGEEFYPYDKYDKFWGSQKNGISKVTLNGKDGLIDIHGKEIVPCKYDRLFIDGDLPQNAIASTTIFDTKTHSYLDREGNEINPSKLGYVYSRDNNGIAKIERNGFFGLINRVGEELAPCIYHSINNFKDGLALAQKGDKSKSRFEYCYGMLDTLGREVVPFKYNGLIFFNKNGFATVKDIVSRKYGIINKSGVEVVPCTYDYLQIIYDSKSRKNPTNLFEARYNGKSGIINSEGDVIVPFQYDWIDNYSYKGMINVSQDRKSGVYNLTINKEVVACNYSHFSFTNDLIISDGSPQHITIFDYMGKQIVPYELNYIEEIKNGFYMVRKNTSLNGDQYSIIDNMGNSIISYKYQYLRPFNENQDILIVSTDREKYGLINMADEIIAPFIYDFIDTPKSDGALALVICAGKRGFLNSKGEEIISCIYDNISLEKDNIIRVEINGKHGFITPEGKELIPCKYDRASFFLNGISYVKLNGKSGIINLRGDEIWFK